MGVQFLDEVVVSDSRFALKREFSGKTVIRIDAEELGRNQGRTLAALLNSKSGIEINGSRGRQGEVLGVFARGGRGRQVLIVIDGIRITDPSSSSQEYDLRLPDLSQIESIEIIKGASSVLYGTNAATAVINITTKKAGQEALAGSFASSFGTNQSAAEQDFTISSFRNNAQINGHTGIFDYRAAISQAYSEHLSSLVTQANEEDPFSSYNADINLGFQLSKGVQLRVFGNKSRFRTGYDESFGFTDASYEYITEQKRVGTSVTASYPNGSLHFNAAFTEFHSRNMSAFPGVFDGKSKAVDIYNKYSIGASFYTLVGLSYINDGAVFDENKDFTLTDPYLNLVYLTDFGLNLNAGFRYNIHSEYGNKEVYSFNPSYRLPVTNGYLKFMTTYATSYITPSLSQLFGQFGANPDLEPETNRTIEAGTEYAVDGTFRTSLLYFNRKEEQYVYFDSAAFLYRNSTSIVRVQGLEWEATWKPSEQLSLEANYTYTHREGDNAIRIPEHKLNVMAGIYLGSKSFCSLQYAYTGTRTDTDFNTFTDVQLDAYSLVNFYFSYELIPGKLKAYLDAENLMNTDYTEITGFTTRGRNFMIGFSLTL